MIARLLCKIFGHWRSRKIMLDPKHGYWLNCDRCGDRAWLMRFHEED